MVSDKYGRYGARKGSPHGSFAGLRSILRRVYPSSGVVLGRSTVLRRC